MSAKVHALDFLSDKSAPEVPPVCVVAGDESFLKREVLTRLEKDVLGDDDGEFALTVIASRDAGFNEMVDAISTMAMFGASRRMVQIEQADDFVSNFRPELESYVDKPVASGVLVLDVKTWPGNTRLAKAVAKTGLTVECKMPVGAKGKKIDDRRVAKWLRDRAKQHHGAKLDSAACEALLAMVEPNFGLLDQELAKLCPMVKPGDSVTVELVERTVGNWRTRTTWEMIDAMLAGKTAGAMRQLDRLIVAGEEPIALLAQIGSSLRKLATATACIRDSKRMGHRMSLKQALQQAGVNRYFIEKSEEQLRHLGRARASRLFRMLLEADLAMKRDSSSPPRKRLVLDRLIVELSADVTQENNATAAAS